MWCAWTSYWRIYSSYVACGPDRPLPILTEYLKARGLITTTAYITYTLLPKFIPFSHLLKPSCLAMVLTKRQLGREGKGMRVWIFRIFPSPLYYKNIVLFIKISEDFRALNDYTFILYFSPQFYFNKKNTTRLDFFYFLFFLKKGVSFDYFKEWSSLFWLIK